MKLTPILKVGSGREGTLNSNYAEICEKVFKDNVTHLDDPRKVKASWGIKDTDTERECFIWCYKYSNKYDCFSWSVSGSLELLKDIFGEDRLTV